MRESIGCIPPELHGKMVEGFHEVNGLIEKCWRGIWIPNIEANKKRVGDFSKYGYGHLGGTKDGTAYIIGAGPSLAKNIHDLKKGSGDVWSSAHSLKYCMKEGLRPDYTVVLDGKDVQADWLDIGEDSKGMKLLMDIHCTPRIFDVWKGEIVFFRTTAKGMDKFSQDMWNITDFDHVVMSGGNVVTAMYYIVMTMGYKRVVFVGNDLSFSGEYPGYADGSVDDGFRENGKGFVFRDLEFAVDIFGNVVRTLQRMFHYKYWLDLRSQENKGIEHINATEAGILGAYPEGNIDSIRQMRLKDVEV